mmetsp:Transcript_21714/g.63478  ORF Transcript_21714/g.63478 Transcript_21714/m.63478 type:complete len:117 (+) Transcript_21714:25-375(+)
MGGSGGGSGCGGGGGCGGSSSGDAGSGGGIVDVDCAVDALVAAVLAGAPRAVQDPWGCLGLQRLTGREASRKRYLQLVRRLHPDRCGHPRAGECFALVEEAWRAIEAHGEGGRSAG